MFSQPGIYTLVFIDSRVEQHPEQVGDQINVTLSSAANNLRKWIRLRLKLFFNLIYKTLKTIS